MKKREKNPEEEELFELDIIDDLEDDEDFNAVSDETLEFLCLDDEMIEAYEQKMHTSRSKKQKPVHKSRKRKNMKRQEFYEEDELDEEDYEDEEFYEADEDDEDEEFYENDEDDEEEFYEVDEEEEDEIDEEEYDDEEYYEDEEDEEPYKKNIFVRFGYFITHMSALDHVVMMFGCFILAAAIVTGSIYLSARTTSKQVEAFAEIGAEIEGISVIGESGLLAVSDAESSRLSQMIEAEPEEQEIVAEEKEDGIEVGMNLTSIQSDIKIKFVNKKTNKLLGGVPFEVEVSGDNGKNFSLKDEDKDGVIYQTGIAAGTYTVKMVALQGEEYKKYLFPSQGSTVKVTDTIAYKKVDVADEIKTEAEVNVAAEDTAKQDTVVESALKDTVEWVESTKKGQDSDANYQEIQKADIPDPSLTGKMGGMFAKMVNTGNPVGGEGGSGSGTGGEGDSGSGTGGEGGSGSGTGGEGGSGSGTGGEGGSGSGTGSGAGEGGNGTTTPVQPSQPTDQDKLNALNPSLSSSSVSIKKGESASLSVTVQGNESYSISWSSNNSSVASVNNGTVSGQGVGNATITATVTVGQASVSLNCSVSVVESAPTYSQVVVSGSGSIQVGKTGTVKGTTTPAGGAITWSSSNTGVVTVDSNGTMTGVSVGTATITGTCGNAKGTWNVAVIDSATAVTISGSSTIQVGKTGTVTGKTTPEGGKITWTSDNEKIVKVDSNGTMTGVSVGTANIIGTCGNAKGVWKVSVIDKYTALTVSGSASIKVGKTGTVKGTTTPAGGTIIWTSDNEKIVKVDSNGTMTGVSVGTATITGTCGDAKGTWKVKVISDASTDTTSKLKDKNGKQIYIKNAEGKYIEATFADYYKDQKFYLQKAEAAFSYTGWQTIDGYTYFFDKNGNKVTGDQVIQGAKYSFGSDGRLSSGSGTLGIDVSKWNGSIDWNAVKNSGISYVIIRCGYRGSSTGALIEDPKFASNIKGAKAAGLKVGVYFFSQAVNEVEAVEEASMALNLVKGYGLNYPIFLDVESSGGRGDAIDAGTRTAVCKAFCATIQNSGYAAGVYANKTWFTTHINTGSLTSYKIWLAQYASAPTYTASRYDMWQYSSKGTVGGISGSVDMNISYMNY